jgi:hypothetical protein
MLAILSMWYLLVNVWRSMRWKPPIFLSMYWQLYLNQERMITWVGCPRKSKVYWIKISHSINMRKKYIWDILLCIWGIYRKIVKGVFKILRKLGVILSGIGIGLSMRVMLIIGYVRVSLSDCFSLEKISLD